MRGKMEDSFARHGALESCLGGFRSGQSNHATGGVSLVVLTPDPDDRVDFLARSRERFKWEGDGPPAFRIHSPKKPALWTHGDYASALDPMVEVNSADGQKA